MFETFIVEREEMVGTNNAPIPDCHFLHLCTEHIREED